MSESKFSYDGYELTITLDAPSYSGECEKLEYYTRESNIGSLITHFRDFIDNKKEKQLSEKQLKELKSNINLFEKETREINSRFHNYLLSQGFVFRVVGGCEEKTYCVAIYSNFLKDWEERFRNRYWEGSIPGWAEIEVTYEVYKAK